MDNVVNKSEANGIVVSGTAVHVSHYYHNMSNDHRGALVSHTGAATPTASNMSKRLPAEKEPSANESSGK